MLRSSWGKGVLASYQSTIRLLRPPFLSHYLPKIFIEPSGGGKDTSARCHFHFQDWEEVGRCRKASADCLLGSLEEPPWKKQLESQAWRRPALTSTREVHVCRTQVQGQSGLLSKFKGSPSNFLRPPIFKIRGQRS